MRRIWPAFIGVIALAAPAPPALAQAGPAVFICGGGSVTLPINAPHTPMGDSHGCCKGACHAGCDRRQLSGRKGARSNR